MKRVSSAAVLVLAMLGVAAPALAEEGADHGLGLSAGVVGGTNGLGLEAGYRFSRHFGVRANSGDYKYDHSEVSDDFDVDGNIKLKSIGALLDIYPFGGSFRLSVGMRSNDTAFRADAVPTTATVEVGDDTYTQAEVGTLTGTVGFKKSAPMVALGWGGKFKTGLHFGIEVGVVVQGNPQINATSNGSLASDPLFRASLDDQLAEWQQDINDNKYSKYWPVVQLHLMYRF
jgi:hypothetical protein